MCLTQIKHAQIKINLLSFWTVHNDDETKIYTEIIIYFKNTSMFSHFIKEKFVKYLV